MIQIYTKTFYKLFSGEHAPRTPLTKRMRFPMRSMSLCDMQISKSEKKNSWPPLPNPGYAPEGIVFEIVGTYYHILIALSCGAYNAVHRYCQGIRGYALPIIFFKK